MKHKILLTGAFGNVGQNTLKQLLKRNYEVKCFELQNKKNEKIRKQLLEKGEFKTIWGDILEKGDVKKAVQGVDFIIHLAAIIPPLSENNPELAYKVNVEGTRNLVNAAKSLPNKPKVIMASSVSVYGITMEKEPPVSIDTPLNPSNNYARTKVECEKMLRESALPWLILRLGAVSVEEFQAEFDPLLFEMPLEQRIEFVSSIDCGIAFTNAVELEEINRIYLIGGGEGCQLLEKEFLKGLFDGFGLKMLPEEAFKKPQKREDWFYIDWMDTEESQRALQYQTETFDQYVERIKETFRWKRLGMKLIAPLAKWFLLKKSPYYES
ncbi:MAG: NAD(P)-dependent oxidoreductase [Promethearchaeota archaeon]|nr:MAG: NAD(P)-dependent oxidoreductase [Candidatus Lokiarchaeota archaeon]